MCFFGKGRVLLEIFLRYVIGCMKLANEYINILKCDIDVIHHARKPLLFDGSHS